MKYETAGDPMSSLKWTRKTTQKIADALDSIDIKVSKTTIGKILKNLGFSLKTNIKRISNGGKVLTKKEKQNRLSSSTCRRRTRLMVTIRSLRCRHWCFGSQKT